MAEWLQLGDRIQVSGHGLCGGGKQKGCGNPRVLVTSTGQMQTPPDIHSEAFLQTLMRRQLRLSIVCAATFLIALLGLPLLNYFFPEVMARRVFGFTLTWFILGVLFFPFVWVISFYFIKRSIALEDNEVKEVKGEGKE